LTAEITKSDRKRLAVVKLSDDAVPRPLVPDIKRKNPRNDKKVVNRLRDGYLQIVRTDKRWNGGFCGFCRVATRIEGGIYQLVEIAGFQVQMMHDGVMYAGHRVFRSNVEQFMIATFDEITLVGQM
jgi:hypothetical protein